MDREINLTERINIPDRSYVGKFAINEKYFVELNENGFLTILDRSTNTWNTINVFPEQNNLIPYFRVMIDSNMVLILIGVIYKVYNIETNEITQYLLGQEDNIIGFQNRNIYIMSNNLDPNIPVIIRKINLDDNLIIDVASLALNIDRNLDYIKIMETVVGEPLLYATIKQGRRDSKGRIYIVMSLQTGNFLMNIRFPSDTWQNFFSPAPFLINSNILIFGADDSDHTYEGTYFMMLGSDEIQRFNDNLISPRNSLVGVFTHNGRLNLVYINDHDQYEIYSAGLVNVQRKGAHKIYIPQ